MAHDPLQDHIFGDPEEAQHAAGPVPPGRRVPFAGMFGAHDSVREADLHLGPALRAPDAPRSL